MQERKPYFLALKAALACVLALVLDRVLGNPDSVSSTFVAVLSVSPIVLMGIRQAWAQLVGSLVGGGWGTLANLIGINALIGVPLAVYLAIFSTYLARVSSGYPVAAFTALYVILVPWGTPWETFEVRVLAVLIGALSGFLINLLISAMLYHTIFVRRLEHLERNIFQLFQQPNPWTPEVAEPGFAHIAAFQSEMGTALDELRFRKNHETYHQIRKMWWRTEHLRYILHQVCTMGYILEEQALSAESIQPFMAWLVKHQGKPPILPAPIDDVAHRIFAAIAALDSGKPLDLSLIYDEKNKKPLLPGGQENQREG